MKHDEPTFVFDFCSGEKCRDQAVLNHRYRYLHGKNPDVNAVIGCIRSDRLAVFDGNHWREILFERFIWITKPHGVKLIGLSRENRSACARRTSF